MEPVLRVEDWAIRLSKTADQDALEDTCLELIIYIFNLYNQVKTENSPKSESMARALKHVLKRVKI